jgi:dTDP-L-rhamnose 4-epimerase
MKTILITGGAGFIGTHLSLALIDKGYKIKVLDILSPQIHGENPMDNSFLFNKIKGKVDFIFGSITEREDILSALKGVDIIVHYVAETGTGQSMYELKRYSDVNLGGTSLLLDVLSNTEHQVKKIVVASSRAIYGEGMYMDLDGIPYFPKARNQENLINGDFRVYDQSGKNEMILVATPESAILDPVSFYGLTKLFQEQAILLVSKSIGIEAVALRYQNVYGPGQSLKNPYTGLLAVFSNQIIANKDINIFEDGLESRDFIYIDDVVNATILAIEKPEANGKAFNVGTGVATSVIRIASILKDLYNSNVGLNITGDFRTGDIRHNYSNNQLIEELLGFKSKISIEKGLANFVEWVKCQPNETGEAFSESIEEMISKKMFYRGGQK